MSEIKPPQPDLKRLKWIDPLDESRFHRKDLQLSDGQCADQILQNLRALLDETFSRLSVFQSFDETTSRGAKAKQMPLMDCSTEVSELFKIEQKLLQIHESLKAKQQCFIQNQLKKLPVGQYSKLHIGSANHQIPDWINVDAGGGDMALNVNWGIPFESDSLNFIYCSHMLEHLRYFDQAPLFLCEINRVLKVKGVLRLVVPDIHKLLTAYVVRDKDFFYDRAKYYLLNEGFLDRDGIATLDYVLLYSGVGPQTQNYNHKFGYDYATLTRLLLDSGFCSIRICEFQQSPHQELRIDNHSFDACASMRNGSHFSMFIEAVK